MTEVGALFGNDSITVDVDIQHLVGPHFGESAPNPAMLPIDLSVTGTGDGWDFDTDVALVAHDNHRDAVIGLVGALSEDMDILKYDLHFVGIHQPLPLPPEPAPPPPIGQAELVFVDPDMAGASAVWGVVDDQIHMVVGGASSTPLEIVSAAILDEQDQIVVDFTEALASEHETALLGDVHAPLSEIEQIALLSGMFRINIETSQGNFSGQMTLAGDCNGDGSLDAPDLACVHLISPNTSDRDTVLAALGTVAGDLNGNGEVAFADFLVLSENFGDPTKNKYTDGDIDLVGGPQFADFLILAENFGFTAGAAAAVPEPRSLTLLGLGGLLLGLARRRGLRELH